MTRVYRILRRRYSTKPLNGEGAYRFGGRWSSPGTRLAYTSQHLSLAILEYFVHIESGGAPKDLVVITAEVPDSVSRVHMAAKQLPRNWRHFPASPDLAKFGDEFVHKRRAGILVVPSVLAPAESNWLINPGHPEFSRIRLHPPAPFQYDSRFFKI